MNKRYALWLLSLALWLAPLYAPVLFVGCTTSQKAVAYKSLAVVATSVDSGMKAFADAVVAGKVPQATQDKVRVLHGQYQKAMQAAITAARFDLASATPETMQALASQLLTIIAEAVK